MRCPRLYLPQPLPGPGAVTVEGDRAHYLRTVLRLRSGDELTVFNGAGGEFAAVVLAVGRHRVRLQLGSWHGREVESPLRIHLGLGIAKGERMDWVVQKAVELGAWTITPLRTERCNVAIRGDKAERKRRHWQAVAVSACEQCGRNRVPEVRLPHDFDTWLAACTPGLLLDPSGVPLPDCDPHEDQLTVLTGPEGGLSPAECRAAQGRGFVPARLGPRILRVETAVVAALSVLQSRWGDLH